MGREVIQIETKDDLRPLLETITKQNEEIIRLLKEGKK